MLSFLFNPTFTIPEFSSVRGKKVIHFAMFSSETGTFMTLLIECGEGCGTLGGVHNLRLQIFTFFSPPTYLHLQFRCYIRL